MSTFQGPRDRSRRDEMSEKAEDKAISSVEDGSSFQHGVKRSIYYPAAPSIFGITLPSKTTICRFFKMPESSARYSSLPAQEANSPTRSNDDNSNVPAAAEDENEPLYQVKKCALFPEFRGNALKSLNFSEEDNETISDLLSIFDDLQKRHADNWTQDKRRWFLWQPAAHLNIIQEHSVADWITVKAEYRKSLTGMKKVLQEHNNREEAFKQIIPLFDAPLKALRDAKDKGLKDHLQLTKQRTNIIAKGVTFAGVAVGVLMWMKKVFFPDIPQTVNLTFTGPTAELK